MVDDSLLNVPPIGLCGCVPPIGLCGCVFSLCFVVHYLVSMHSSFAIISTRKRELVALL